MAYRKATMYFMTGTGNSYRVATWLGELAEQAGAESRVQTLETADPAAELEASPEQLVGLFTPTHGFTAPWHVIKFAAGLPRKPGAHAFVLATRAGMKFGPLQPPGIAGTCTFVLALLLMLRGYRVRGVKSLNMPSNWWSAHPIPGEKLLNKIVERSKPKADQFGRRILAGGNVWFTLNNLYELLLGLALAPITAGYLSIGKVALAKLYFANSRCDGCGLCAQFCPVQSIQMLGKETPRPYWRYNCESCMRCAAVCPHDAVEASHSWAILLYVASSAAVTWLLVHGLGAHLPWLAALEGTSYESWLIATAWTVALIGFGFLLHALNKNKVVNWLFAHTTLTHYWSRYMEPGTKTKDLRIRRKKDQALKRTP